MTIKIKLKPDNKAIIRFKDSAEMDFFRFVMTRIRDDPSKNHPPVSIKTPDNKEVPKLPVMKPQTVVGQPIQQQITIPAQQPVEQPIIVAKAQPEKSIRYYSKEQLTAENKQQCSQCKFNTVGGVCRKEQPQEYYWDERGNILGCPEGEAMLV